MKSLPAEVNDLRLILFDGVCNLCNASIDFVVKTDKKRQFRIASLQSELGQFILETLDLPADDFDSFVLVDGGKVYQKSTAAIRVMSSFGGLWSLMSVFLLVPGFLRNAVYGWVARNRYRWFGKKETCRLPTPEERALFYETLDDAGITAPVSP